MKQKDEEREREREREKEEDGNAAPPPWINKEGGDWAVTQRVIWRNYWGRPRLIAGPLT